MKTIFDTAGTCAKQIIVEVDNGTKLIKSVEFVGGCPGNTLGVSRLATGRTPQEVIAMCEGINCREKGTSCPDQLARALRKLL